MRPPTAGGASQTPRPYSRSGSRIGSRNDEETIGAAVTSNSRTTSQGSVPSFSQPLRSPSRLGSAGGSQDQEIARLKSELKERDKRLDEQAASLADMEQSVKELSNIIPSDGVGSPNGKTRSIGSFGGDDDTSAAQLRQILREKNEKISLLTAEFDAHRADFRSTLDSLEMASTETERVYEEQKRDLMQQLAELQEVKESKEDFEGITTQLKQLEELVAELEEGLEESRRGEAEARGEVEFLRGEVERGRSELKREREKAAATVSGNSGTSSAKELEQKDDEIRGLKAIIHGLSSNPGAPNAGSDATPNGILADAGEVERLQVALDEAQNEKESLEQEIEQLRRDAAATNGTTHARNESERTATAPESRTPVRSRSNTVKATVTAHASNPPPLPTADNTTPSAETNDGVYCEMCESSSHDTLDCTKLRGDTAAPYSPGKENESLKANSKMEQDEDKWCALCEKDGHLAFDCPEEQY
jgi:chromosome segregation ATPase